MSEFHIRDHLMSSDRFVDHFIWVYRRRWGVLGCIARASPSPTSCPQYRGCALASMILHWVVYTMNVLWMVWGGWWSMREDEKLDRVSENWIVEFIQGAGITCPELRAERRLVVQSSGAIKEMKNEIRLLKRAVGLTALEVWCNSTFIRQHMKRGKSGGSNRHICRK